MAGGTHGELVRLVAGGQGQSRAELARLSGLAPSSISLRVEELIAAGLLEEDGTGTSRGGRRPRRLRLRDDAGVVAVADVGSHHVRLAVADLTGRHLRTEELPCDIADGPEKVLAWIAVQVTRMLGAAGPHHPPLRGVAVGMPGPVDPRTGSVVAPSRMPGWNGFGVRAELAALVGVPVLVENDANLMAVGEHRHTWPDRDNLMVIKAGTGIGCGIIAAGRLHRGPGAAGDISHVPVIADTAAMCSCGHTDCLEAHASGAALCAMLSRQGIPAADPSELVALVQQGNAEATNLVRAGGRMLGQVLTALVNFFNPDVVTIGGSLSAAEPYLSAIRGAIYGRCLPLATRDLEITNSGTGRDAAVLGATALLLDQVLVDGWVDDAVAAH